MSEPTLQDCIDWLTQLRRESGGLPVRTIQHIRELEADRNEWRKDAGDRLTRLMALEADLADSRLIAREQENSHIAANLRNTHLQEHIDRLETARDRLLAACDDSEAAQYGTLSTSFVEMCFAAQRDSQHE